jgi:hypothetical protein
MEEQLDPLLTLNSALHAVQQDEKSHAMTAECMGPPPLPSSLAMRDARYSVSSNTSTAAAVPTTPEEARRALEVVLTFLEQQPNGYLDLQESITVGKLMEKLKLHSRT